jgi:glycerol-3-phosphate acyltransferase PlsY
MSHAAIQSALILLAAYLIGSIPFAVVCSRLFGLADPRSFGSGNPGATNVLRSGNKLAALLTLLGDAAKGAMAVLLAQAWMTAPDAPSALTAWAGLLAFAGHLFPVFLRFRGGKGVATFLGTILMFSPIVGVFTCLLWLGVAVWTRYSSLASMVCSASAVLAFWGTPSHPGVLPATALMAVLLWWRHRLNLQRLMVGAEPRIGHQPKALEDAEANPKPPGA